MLSLWRNLFNKKKLNIDIELEEKPFSIIWGFSWICKNQIFCFQFNLKNFWILKSVNKVSCEKINLNGINFFWFNLDLCVFFGWKTKKSGVVSVVVGWGKKGNLFWKRKKNEISDKLPRMYVCVYTIQSIIINRLIEMKWIDYFSQNFSMEFRNHAQIVKIYSAVVVNSEWAKNFSVKMWIYKTSKQTKRKRDQNLEKRRQNW